MKKTLPKVFIGLGIVLFVVKVAQFINMNEQRNMRERGVELRRVTDELQESMGDEFQKEIERQQESIRRQLLEEAKAKKNNSISPSISVQQQYNSPNTSILGRNQSQ